MTLAACEFIRRFLLHVLPPGFHRIRHYGLLANTRCRENLVRARELLLNHESAASIAVAVKAADPPDNRRCSPTYRCPACGAAMVIMETLVRGQLPRAPPIRIGEPA